MKGSLVTEAMLIDVVRAAAASVLQRRTTEIGPDSRLIDDLGIGSTSALELLIEIEARAPVEFDVDTLEEHHFATVRSLASYVGTQLEGRPCS